jgi:hypothetical protein
LVNKIVIDIESAISEVAGLQKDYVSMVCSRCLQPCCRRVGYIYSDKDILFLKLSGKKPVRKRRLFGKKGCSFLGPDGCLLDILSRPFICHRYICPDLKTAINEEAPEILATLEGRFELIDEMRSLMWSEYLDSVMEMGVEVSV